MENRVVGAHGDEFWSTDGTPAGTARVLDIAPGLFGSYPRGLVAWRGQLYFRARDAVHGMELWTSDGTAAGTRLVQDIAPGTSWSIPTELTPTEGRPLLLGQRRRARPGAVGAAGKRTVTQTCHSPKQACARWCLTGRVPWFHSTHIPWSRRGPMAGFCEVCGRTLEKGRCPEHAPTVIPKPIKLSLPRASTPRRLVGSGIEYSAYLVGVWVITFLDFISTGLMGLLALVLVGLIVLRDFNAGAFSIAKRVSNMKVVDWRSGQSATNTQALVRNSYYLGLLLLALLPMVDLVTSPLFTFFIAVDVLMILANPKGRRLGDFLASTQVVEARS